VNFFQKALLAIVLVETAFPLDVYLDYQEAEAAYGAIGGWNVSVTMFCLALLYAAWLPHVAVRKPRLEPELLRAAAPGLFYFGVVALSAVYSVSLKLTLFEVVSVLALLLLFFYLVCWVRTRADVQFVVGILLLGLALESLVMIALRAKGQGVEIGPLTARIDNFSRVGGTIGSPNEAGSYLTLMLGLAIGVFLTSWPTWLRAGAAVAFGLGAAALITTLSRGAWLASGIAVMLGCGLALVRGRLPLWAPALVAVAGAVAVAAYSDAIEERLSRHDKGAAYSRIPLMKIAARVIEEQPVLGAGANTYTVAMKPHALSGRFRGGFIYVVHNRYLLAWAELGLVGLAAFAAFLGAILYRGWRLWGRNDPYLAPVGLGIMAGLTGEMLHMSTEVFRGRPVNQLLWILAGLVAAMMRIEEDSRPC
jgi:O-antigen ligase